MFKGEHSDNPEFLPNFTIFENNIASKSGLKEQL